MEYFDEINTSSGASIEMSHHKKVDRKPVGASGGGSWGGGVYKAMVGGCCVCSEEQGWDENPLVYCDGDGCSVAVHKHCYGIIKVPAGSWFCRLVDIVSTDRMKI